MTNGNKRDRRPRSSAAGSASSLPPRRLLAAVGAAGRPLPCFVSCDPFAALVLPSKSENLAHSPALPQGIEAPLGPGASASAEVLQAGRAVVRCQCREDPLLAELGPTHGASNGQRLNGCFQTD